MMYWNSIGFCSWIILTFLNQNIWCIEILITIKLQQSMVSWTKTYDVLKLAFIIVFYFYMFLNQNIWCIEMQLSSRFNVIFSGLNQNIWCIEIWLIIIARDNDSLEPKHMMYWNTLFLSSKEVVEALNQNIWCIEIKMLHK